MHAFGYPYVWKFKYKEKYYLPVDHHGLPDDQIQGDFLRFKLAIIPLFPPPDKYPYNEWIKKIQIYNGYLNDYFKDVLAIKESEKLFGLQLNEISRIVIPEDKLREIDLIIHEFSLGQHRDFILYIIVKIQQVFIDEIEDLEAPEEIKRIRELDKEVEKLKNILENVDFSNQKYKNKRVRLKQVRFTFDTEGHITIKDSDLLHSIVNGILDRWGFKEWKERLNRYPSVYDKNQREKKFRPRLATALHNFFTDEGIFHLNGKKILDEEAHCIAKIMNIAGVVLYNRQGKMHDVDVDSDNVISLIKIWCDRTDIT